MHDSIYDGKVSITNNIKYNSKCTGISACWAAFSCGYQVIACYKLLKFSK